MRSTDEQPGPEMWAKCERAWRIASDLSRGDGTERFGGPCTVRRREGSQRSKAWRWWGWPRSCSASGCWTGPNLASTWEGAWDGVVSQLPVTFPAALIVLVATLIQLAAGIGGGARPARPPVPIACIDALLGGLVGAVVIGLVALMLLGSLGIFRLPVAAAGERRGHRPGLVRPPDLRRDAAAPPRLADRRRRAGRPGVVRRGGPPARFAGRAVHRRPAQPRRAGPAPGDLRRVRRPDHRALAHLRAVAHVPGLHRAAGLGHRPERAAGGPGGRRVHPPRHRPGRGGHGPPRVRRSTASGWAGGCSSPSP